MLSFAKMKKVIHWLGQESLANTIPSFYIDKIINIFLKLFYLFVRVLFRITLGKKRREQNHFFRKLRHTIDVSYSFNLCMYLYKVIRILKLGNPSLIKIYVPKYKYKVYCPATKDDFSHMTEREDDILQHFKPNSGDIVIDVGAHLGRYTLISSNKVGTKGKVIAIEANPQVVELLKKNLNLNIQSKNVIPLNYAVYSHKSKIKLFLHEQSIVSVYSPHNTVVAERYNRSRERERFVEVTTDTLDNIINSIGINLEKINWIKIDVEGAELEVLKGAHNILSKSKDIALLIEVHNIAEGRNLYENIMELLKTYNFKIEFEKIHEGGERHMIMRKILYL
jgi:FkbM family methyltransferase